jgi:hypothetical protein
MAEPDFNDILGITPVVDEPYVEPEAAAPEPVAPAPEPEPEAAPEPAHRNTAQERIQELIRERNEERAALQAERANAERIRAELEQLKAAPASPPPLPDEPIPDFLEDPQGHVAKQIEATRRELAAMEARVAAGNKAAIETANLTRQQLEQQQLVQRVGNMESSFLVANPDYYKALEYTRNLRVQELSLLGISQEQIDQALHTEAMNTTLAALNLGKNPAEFAYNRAKLQGYKAEAAAPAAPAKPSVDEQAELAQRKAMAGTIGGGGVGDPDGMSDPEERSWEAINRAFKEQFGQELK